MASLGPDVQNYLNFSTESGILTRLPYAYIISKLKSIIEISFLSILLASFSTLVFNLRNFESILIAYILLMLYFFMSYSANSLFGNILRQGMSTIILLLAFKLSQTSTRIPIVFTSILIHFSSLIVYVFTLYNRRQVKHLISFKTFTLVILFSTLIIVFFNDRILVLVERRVSKDLSGFLFVYFLIIVRCVFFRNFLASSQKVLIIYLTVLFCLVIAGEYGQRILISLIFILDMLYLGKNYKYKSVFLKYMFLLSFESAFRYGIIGNFWGPTAV